MAKQPKRRGKSKKWTRYFFPFFLGVLLIVGGYLYLTRKKTLSQEDFSKKISLIDQIVQGQLYEMGIQKKNIVRDQSSPKKEGGLTWKRSSFKIQVPPSHSFSLIEENFRRSLTPMGEPVSMESFKISESLQLDIKILDRVTHQLTFIPPPPATTPLTPSTPKTTFRPKIAIVIDDLGDQDKISQEILHWDVPVTLAILPFTPYSKTLAGEAHRRGKEVILHLPMEPQGYPQIRPGKGVLLGEMNEKKLLRQLAKDIDAVPYITGVSNHMGSRLMEEPEKIEIVFSELKRRQLFFLDSRTTPQTVGLQVAQSVGLKAVERNIFIDNSSTEEDIEQQLEQLIQLSLSKGRAIGIGHPHPSTLKSIREMIPRLKKKGIDLVPLSALVE